MEDNNKAIRLSGLIHESLVNGPGIRRVFFSQGCLHNCIGCFNPETHSFSGGELFDMDKLIEDVRVNPMLSGITFSGGDPFEQADKFTYLAEAFKALRLNIWCYTGYTFEHIIKNIDDKPSWKALMECIDVLIDGKFHEEEKDETLKYRGSGNQRIINVQESLKSGRVIVEEFK